MYGITSSKNYSSKSSMDGSRKKMRRMGRGEGGGGRRERRKKDDDLRTYLPVGR